MGKKNWGKLHKKQRKGLKNASFWVINSKKNYSSGEKMNLKRGGGGWSNCTIYIPKNTCSMLSRTFTLQLVYIAGKEPTVHSHLCTRRVYLSIYYIETIIQLYLYCINLKLALRLILKEQLMCYKELTLDPRYARLDGSYSIFLGVHHSVSKVQELTTIYHPVWKLGLYAV